MFLSVQILASVLLRGCMILVGFAGVHVFVNIGSRQSFTGQELDGGRRMASGDGRDGRVTRSVTVIVVFEVFENVADVEERVAIQADLDESRLHAREDASYFTFVDAADERKLFFALDVDFD
jgi:hypothetical protein